MSVERAERMSWWRAHHGMPSHPRWLQAARKSGQSVPVTFAVAMWMLDHASRSEDRGSITSFDVGPCAAYLWIDEADVAAVVASLNSIGWLDNGRIASWSDRQPIREDVSAAARKRAQRERDAEEKSRMEREAADVSHDVTQCHDDVSPCHGRVEKSREDKKEDTALNVRDRKNLDGLETQLRDAAGLSNDPSPGLMVLSTPLGWIDQGISLEDTILPVLRSRRKPGIRSWSYFGQAVLDSHASRIAAAHGTGNARASPTYRSEKRHTSLQAGEELLLELQADRHH